MPELTEEQHATLKELRKRYHAETAGEGMMQRAYQNWLEERYLELESQLVELGEQLEFDRSLVADCLTKARKAVASRDWLTQGRGCYEWNDDRWHEEFRYAANGFLIALEPMSKVAHDWSGCPRSGKEIARARRNLKDQIAASQERERIMWEALESMRQIYENQQMSTLTVAGKMLEVSMDALKEASTKSQPATEKTHA